MIRALPRLGSGGGDPPGVNADHPMRAVTRQAAFEPGGWGRERATEVTALFDGLADDWDTRDHPGRLAPLEDALARGGPEPGGLWLEIGSGTGLATPLLAGRGHAVVSLDLSVAMLERARGRSTMRVRADAASLPIADGAAGCVVLVNALLFPGEVDRVLAPGGAVVWVSTSGDSTPIYLSAEDVAAALPGSWEGTTSAAGSGTWTVLRRSLVPMGGS